MIVTSDKNSKVIIQINLFLCLYIIAWVMLPLFRSLTNQGVFQLLFFIIISIWLATSLQISRKWFYELLIISFIGIFHIIIVILYHLFGYGDMIITQLVPILVLFLFAYMGYFYYFYGKSNIVNIIIKFIAFCFLITATTTSYNLLINLNVSRLMTSSSTSSLVIQQLEMRNIAGFDFIYGTLILIPMLFLSLNYSIKNKKNGMFFIMLSIMSLAITVVALSNFTIAYLLLLIAFSLSFFSSYKNIYLVFILIAAITVFLAPFLVTILIDILEFIKGMTPSIMTQNKMLSMINVLEGKSDVNSISTRYALIENSINSFKSHPLLGAGAYYHNYNIIGGHSQFLDDLARYGVIGSSPLFIFMSSILIMINRGINKIKVKNTFIFSSLLFVVLGFLNPIQSYGIIFSVFLVLPLLTRYIQEN